MQHFREDKVDLDAVADHDTTDFPAPAMLPTIADEASKRSHTDTEAWGGWSG